MDIIEGVLGGDLTYYHVRYFRLDPALLFDRPETEPVVAMAAGGIQAAHSPAARRTP